MALIIFKSILYILFFTIVSVLLGRLIVSKLNKDKKSILLSYVVGVLLLMAIFYPIALIITFVGGTLTQLTTIWMAIIILLAVISIVYERNAVCSLAKNGLSFLKKTDNNGMFILIIAIIIIAFQIIFVCFMQHSDADDATYVGMATTSYFTDTVNSFQPTDGSAVALKDLYQYALAPFPVLFASLGKVFTLHPAIIMHTIMPINYISLAYSVYYLIGKKLLKSPDKTAWFLLFSALINLFGNWSIRSTSTFLLFRIWQGKAVLCAVIIPLIIYVFLRLESKNSSKCDWFLLLLVTTSACLVSGMGPILCVPMVIIYMLIDLVIKRKLQRLLPIVICLLPCCVVAFIYIKG